MYKRRFAAAFIALTIAACSGEVVVTPDATVPARTPARWDCPSGWVPLAAGGCGPAFSVCAPGGGGDPAACRAVEGASDGGTALHRLADGGIGGGWIEPGEPGGPPAVDWMPSDLPDPVAIRAQLTWTCPTGWRLTAEGVCDPQLSTSCPAGTSPLPGGRCTPTGMADCPSGDVPALPMGATGRVIHVRPGTTITTPTGEVDAPYASLARAVAAAPAGAWLLVGAGELRESVRVTRDVHVVGLCAARTQIVASGSEPAVNVVGASAALDLRGVTIQGGVGGLWVSEGGSANAERVVISRSTRMGVRVDGMGSRAALRDGVVRDTATESDGSFGYGVEAVNHGMVSAAQMAVEGNVAVGVLSVADSTVTLEDVTVRSTRAQLGDSPSSGVQVQERSALTATRIALVSNDGLGIAANDGASLVLTDAFVFDTHATASDFGAGVTIDHGSTAEVRRCSAVQNEYAGIVAVGRDTSLTLDEVIVRQTRGAGGSTLRGTGLRVSNQAHARGTRFRFNDNDSIGVLVEGATAELTTGESFMNRGEGAASKAHGVLSLRDIVVEGCLPVSLAASLGEVRLSHAYVLPSVAGRQARGVEVGTDGVVTADHTVIDGAAGLGVLVASTGQLSLSSCVIRNNVVAREGVRAATALQIQDAGRATVVRSVIVDAHFIAVAVNGEHAALTLMEDSVIRRTHPLSEAAVENSAGRAVEVVSGASATLRRVHVDESYDIAVLANQGGTSLTMEHCALTRTGSRPDGYFGDGLYVGGTATVNATGLIVSEAHQEGIVVNGSTLVLNGSVVRDTLRGTSNLADGVGLNGFPGAHISLTEVLLQRSPAAGMICTGGDTVCEADGLVIADNRVTREDGHGRAGPGFGAITYGARLVLRRTSVLAVNTLGVASIPTDFAGIHREAELSAEDLFVRAVAGREINVATEPFSFGLYVAGRSTLSATRAVLTDGGWGFVQSGGRLVLRNVVINGQTDAAGAIAPSIPQADAEIGGLSASGNRVDTIQRVVLSAADSLVVLQPCPDPPCDPSNLSRTGS